eukprot:g17555.t1
MFRSRPDTAQGAARSQQAAREHAQTVAGREDDVPRSLRKSKQGREQDAAFRKQMRKAVKTERKSGGINRGELFDAEEMAHVVHPDGGAGGAAESESDAESTGEGSRSEGEEDTSTPENNAGGASASKSRNKPGDVEAGKFFIPFRPADLGEDADAFEEKRKKIEQKLVTTLKNWSMDLNCDHAKAVRSMYAAWHPDKHIGKVYHDTCRDIFQSLQAEVRRLIAERERRFAKFEAVKKQREEKKSEKHAEKEQRRVKHAERAARSEQTKGAPDGAKADETPNEPALEQVDGARIKVRFSSAADVVDQPAKVVERAEVKNGATSSPSAVCAEEHSSDDDSSEDDDCPDLVPVEEAGARPPARSHFSLTAVSGESAILFGGESTTGEDDRISFHKDYFELRLQQNGAKNVSKFAPLIRESDGADAASGPCARSAHQSACVDGSLFVFGGEWSSADGRRFRQFDDLWEFNTKSAKPSWSRVTNLGDDAPCARSGHRMVTLGGKLYVFGGFAEQKNGNVKYLSDFFGGELVASAASSQNGNATKTSNALGAAHQIKWVRDKRSKITKPSARAGFAMWARGADEIYVFGGSCTGAKGDLKVLHDLWVFNTASLQWSEVPISGIETAFTVTRELCDVGGDNAGATGELSKSAKKRAKKKAKAAVGAGAGAEGSCDGDTAQEESGTGAAGADSTRPQERSEPVAEKQVRLERKFVPRSGLSCAKWDGDRVLFFGGVSDVVQDKGQAKSGLAVFHNDVIVLDVAAKTCATLWSPYHAAAGATAVANSTSGPESVIAAAAPTEQTGVTLTTLALQTSDKKVTDDSGGVDLAKLLLGGGEGAEKVVYPRGRIGAQSLVASDVLYVFGGGYEVGPRRECSLDDLWAMPLSRRVISGRVPKWECVLQFSREVEEEQLEEIEEEMDDEEVAKNTKLNALAAGGKKKKKKEATASAGGQPAAEVPKNAEDCTVVSLVDVKDPAQLSKKERQKWEKKQRQEVKIVKQMEKEAKKNAKKSTKMEQQKSKAKGDNGNGDDGSEGEEAES